jgi:hypothetical protein
MEAIMAKTLFEVVELFCWVGAACGIVFIINKNWRK